MDFEEFKAEMAKKGEEPEKPSSDPMGGVQQKIKWRCPRCTGWVKEMIGKACLSCKMKESVEDEFGWMGMIH